MNLLAIDFETYYAKGLQPQQTDYRRIYTRPSLRGYWRCGQELSSWSSCCPTLVFWVTKKQVDQISFSITIGRTTIALAHNAMFDMAILNWHFDIKPKKIADTLAMARAIHSIEVGGSLAALSEYYELGAKGTEVHAAIGKRRLDFSKEDLKAYGGYCQQDVELTLKLFQVLGKGFPVFELNLIDLTLRMFSEPTLVLDKEILASHLKEVKDTKEALMAKVSHDKKKLTSNPQFAELLRTLVLNLPLR